MVSTVAPPQAPKRVRGIRNNNPGNIEWGSPWQGLVPKSQSADPRFCQFTTPEWGIRALAVVLTTYYDKRTSLNGTKIDSVSEIIERWAPANENDTRSYAREVAAILAVHPSDEVLDLHDFETMRGVVEGIIRHENGKGPLRTRNTWYTDEQITEGLRRAGVIKDSTSNKGLPLTKETGGAAIGVAIGSVQIAESLPVVVTAMDKAQGDISSGDWVRVAFGVCTVGVSLYIAYAQYKKRSAGAI